MREEVRGAEDGAVAAKGADEVGFVGEEGWRGVLGGFIVRIYGEWEVLMELFCGGGLENDVDGGVCGGEVSCVFYEG